MKNKYVIEITDDFGSTQQLFYICSQNVIEKILYRKYLNLKQKAYKENDEFLDEKQYPCKLHNKRTLRVRDNNLFNFSKKQDKLRTLHLNTSYQVKLDVCFKLMHHLTYKKLDDNAEYRVIEHNMHENSILGHHTRTKAIKVASEAIRTHSLKADMDDEDSIFKNFKKNKITFSFSYWYQCSYEYDEYDVSAIAIIAEKINFKRRYK